MPTAAPRGRHSSRATIHQAGTWCYWLVLLAFPAAAQPARPDSLPAAYPFLNLRAARIENATIGLQRFYQRLLRLQAGELPGRTVSVVLLGDSHTQADELSGEVRREVQARFGNAGHGLVFPYQAARTNGSPSVRFAALAGRWRSRRLLAARPDTMLPLGLAGFTLATADTAALLRLRVPAAYATSGRFAQLTLLRPPGPIVPTWQVLDGRGRLLATVPGAGPGVAAPVGLPSPLDTVLLRPVWLPALAATDGDAAGTGGSAAGRSRAVLFGAVLGSGQPGVYLHAIGVNGATVRHYNRAPQLVAQLPLLAPDLLIVALGTNDAYHAGDFAPAAWQAQLDTLVSRLRRACPLAEVLLLAPPDSYRARRYRNPDLPRLAAVLRAYAEAHDLAFFDLGAAMGGPGSIGRWRVAGLAQPDFVHFTSAGYQLQGRLLSRALLDGLADFRAR